MRVLVAAGLALFLVSTAAAPHGHEGLGGGDHVHDCAVCVVRGAEAARSETPDLAPRTLALEAPVLAPGLAPVTGAPLGAIPGQSPPRAA